MMGCYVNPKLSFKSRSVLLPAAVSQSNVMKKRPQCSDDGFNQECFSLNFANLVSIVMEKWGNQKPGI